MLFTTSVEGVIRQAMSYASSSYGGLHASSEDFVSLERKLQVQMFVPVVGTSLDFVVVTRREAEEGCCAACGFPADAHPWRLCDTLQPAVF